MILCLWRQHQKKHRIQKRQHALTETMSHLLWIRQTSRPQPQLFSLETLSAEEKLPLKTFDGLLCDPSIRDTLTLFKCIFFFNATNKIAIARKDISLPGHSFEGFVKFM